MLTTENYLKEVIPCRMKAIDILRIALGYHASFESPKKLELYLDGMQSVQGLSTAWTNPAIESGIMHCRACLEFLGLKADPKNPDSLKCRSSKLSDDMGIEDFDLPLIKVEEALNPYAGPKEEAEKALATVIITANKGIAHTTLFRMVDAEDLRLLEIAARGVPTLMANHLYIPLGLSIPDYKIAGNIREKSA